MGMGMGIGMGMAMGMGRCLRLPSCRGISSCIVSDSWSPGDRYCNNFWTFLSRCILQSCSLPALSESAPIMK